MSTVIPDGARPTLRISTRSSKIATATWPVGEVSQGDRRLFSGSAANLQVRGSLERFQRGEKFGPIPKTKKEVVTLGSPYGASRSGLFVGGQSTKERAKAEMPRFRVLHFATQGILAGKDPRYSYVLLSRSGSTMDCSM